MRPKARTFEEVEALYGVNMTGVFSGGIVYMYFEETNDFGLVQITGGNDGPAKTLPDYINLQKELAKVDPTGVNMASYSPTNTATRPCPIKNVDWNASSILPPTPDSDLCTCMVQSLNCTSAANIADNQYDSLFSYICFNLPAGGCDGITADGNTGQYGAYSNCLPQQRLAWAMNAYYTANQATQHADACNFNGSAQLQTSSTSTACNSRISQVGGVTGTSSATAGSPAATKSKAAGVALSAPSLSFSAFSICVAILAAFLGGASLVML